MIGLIFAVGGIIITCSDWFRELVDFITQEYHNVVDWIGQFVSSSALPSAVVTVLGSILLVRVLSKLLNR